MVDRTQRPIIGAGRVGAPSPAQPRTRPERQTNEFSAILAKKLGAVKFSSHAETRLRSRGIRIGAEEMKRLEGALDLAAAKGGRNALVLMGDVAMVVSVVNRTVVTAMDKDQAQANVFTNIDSAVIT